MAVVVVGAGLALVVALVVLLTHPGERLAGTNSLPARSFVALLEPHGRVCQGRETIPADASRLQLVAGTYGRPGPAVRVVVRAAGRVVTSGGSPGGYAQKDATFPVRRTTATVPGTTVCIENRGGSRLALGGLKVPSGTDSQAQRARVTGYVRLNWLRPGRPTWAAMAGTIAGRVGRARLSFGGSWCLWTALALLVLSGGMALCAVLGIGSRGGREDVDGLGASRIRVPRLRRVLRPVVLCAAVGTLNAVAWALITPPLQVPDEPQHLAYVQYFAETGHLPPSRPRLPIYSDEEAALAAGVRLEGVAGNREGRPPWTEVEDLSLQHALHANLSGRGTGGLTNVSTGPPIYYAVEAIPYLLSADGSLLDSLLFLRLLSALMAGATVLFVFLFLREAFPASPRAWSAGALVAAFQPVFGFITGGVNNDALLYVAGAALFYLVARTFRRGVTPRLAMAAGAVVGTGILVKTNLVALAPALVLALLLARPRGRSGAMGRIRVLAAFAGVALVPLVLFEVIGATVWHRSLFTAASGGAAAAGAAQTSLGGLVAYSWEFYLPHLPFMTRQFAGYPLWHYWVRGWVGRFGWLDYEFQVWVGLVASFLAFGGLGLAGRELLRRRGLTRRWPEITCYVVAVLGLLALIAAAGYPYHAITGYVFEQARYLLPLLALYGGLVALAVRGAGRAWQPALAALAVCLAFAHELGAIVITLGRYYA